jgi:hypothetical protein
VRSAQHAARSRSLSEQRRDQPSESEIEKRADAEHDEKREPRHDARQRNDVGFRSCRRHRLAIYRGPMIGLVLALGSTFTRAGASAKLSFRDTLRYRLPMGRQLRYRDDDSSNGLAMLAIGAVAGLVAGVFVAQRFGGVSGLAGRLRRRLGRAEAAIAGAADSYVEDELDEEEEEEEEMDENRDETLEERVLEAFRNDPILGERAIDIGAIGEGIIELTGWVHAPDESTLAVTLTRGIPGVETVVNRLAIRDEEAELDENARKHADGDPALTEGHWEGQQVGTGRRRQGTSAEADRHADPKVKLEDRWLGEDEAIREAADDVEAAERRKKAKTPRKGDRTGGSPVAPTGVPKADHVAQPTSTETREVLREQTGRDTI